MEVYNSLINEALKQHNDVQLLVFVHNLFLQEFTVYERALVPIPVNNIQWTKNKNHNLEGREGERHTFTWQPHGSQFTILENLPHGATKFGISKHPQQLKNQDVLNAVGFGPDWIEMAQ